MAEFYGVWFLAQRCDNDMRVYVNGVEQWRKHTDLDPLLDERVLLKNIQGGNNQVRVECINSPQVPGGGLNPYHFVFQIRVMQILNGQAAPPIKAEYANEDISGADAPAGVIRTFDFVVPW